MMEILVDLGSGVCVRPDDIMAVCDNSGYQTGYKESNQNVVVIMRNGVKFMTEKKREDIIVDWILKLKAWDKYLTGKEQTNLNG